MILIDYNDNDSHTDSDTVWSLVIVLAALAPVTSKVTRSNSNWY